MAMNRVQFQPGLSMPEFLQQFGTEAQCEAALQAARWPDGFVCPRCGGSARTSFVRAGLRYWQCGDCARQTSLISGTMFEASKLNRTPFGGRHEATMSVSHGRPVRSLATNREPAVGG